GSRQSVPARRSSDRGRRTLPSGWISASWRGSSGSSDDDARETNGPVQARCVPDPSPRRVGPLRRAGPLVPVRVALRQAPSEEPLLITALSLVAFALFVTFSPICPHLPAPPRPSADDPPQEGTT